MTWLKRLFKGRKQAEVAGSAGPSAHESSSINQGVIYLYSIIGAQVAIVFGLIIAITAFGTVMATPLWLFVLAFMAFVAGCVFIYRKIKQQFRRLRESLRDVNLTDRNYEISLMGGMLTMRVEQNSRPLLEAPSDPPAAGPVVDAEVVENLPPR